MTRTVVPIMQRLTIPGYTLSCYVYYFVVEDDGAVIVTYAFFNTPSGTQEWRIFNKQANLVEVR